MIRVLRLHHHERIDDDSARRASSAFRHPVRCFDRDVGNRRLARARTAGRIEGRREKYPDPLELARQRLEKAVALAPDATTIHYQLGLLYRKLGQTEKAKEHLAKSKQP